MGVVRTQTVKDIIGTDAVFPLAPDQNGDIRLTRTPDENMRQAIMLCIFTTVKERYRHREFGTSVNKSLFKPVTQSLANKLKKEIETSLDKHEYRITDIEVEATPDQKNRKIDIEVKWTDLKYRHKRNLIFPLYTEGGEAIK